MSIYSTIPKLIFDPEIYILIMNEIISQSKTNNINLYTLLFLNSFYMNEFLDQDLEWFDETDDEKKIRIDDRIKNMIKIGIELVNINNVVESKELNDNNDLQINSDLQINNNLQINNDLQVKPNNKNLLQNNQQQHKHKNVKNYQNNNSEKQSVYSEIFNTNNDDSSVCLSDLVDSLPVDDNDEFYKKSKKFNNNNSSSKSVSFC